MADFSVKISLRATQVIREVRRLKEMAKKRWNAFAVRKTGSIKTIMGVTRFMSI